MPQAYTGALSRLALVAGLAVAMAACHKKPEAPSPPAPAPVVAPKPSVPMPARTPGLWETQISEEGSTEVPQILQICVDALTDRHLGILGTDLSGDSCTKKTFSPQGEGSWGILAECAMGAGVVTEYSGSITGNFTTQYSMRVRSQTAAGNSPQMNRVTNYIVESRRIGACAAGQKPGDVVNEGVKMNLFDMAGLKRDGGQVASAEAALAQDAPDVVD